jgi:hypothetical protein
MRVDHIPVSVERKEAAQPTKNKGLENFVCLPNEFLWHPPIRHRGSDPNTGLSVFEFSILGAILLLARTRELKQKRYDYAISKGKVRLAKFKPTATPYKRQGKRSFESHVHNEHKAAGERFFEEERQNFTLDNLLVSKVTRAELLLAAGMVGHPKGSDLQRLQATLVRLTKPIVPGLPPPLREIKQLSFGKLRLAIDAKWIPKNKYGRVLWPPPKHGGGAVVLALDLFIAGCNLRSKISIPVDRLYERIGLTQPWPSHRERAFRQALAAVNNHRALASAAFDPEDWPQVKPTYLSKDKVRHVRFIAVDSSEVKARQRDQAEYEASVKREQKIDKRLRQEGEEAIRYFSKPEQKKRQAIRDFFEDDYDDDDGE